jgi:sulfite reductase (NADPH) flavoprotein alpha-component
VFARLARLTQISARMDRVVHASVVFLKQAHRLLGLFRKADWTDLPAQATDRATAPQLSPSRPVTAQAPWLLAYATQTGAAERFAHDTQAQLQRAGATAQLLAFDALTLDILAAATQTLIIVSTTYDGDAPDMAEAFEARWMDRPASLAQLRYGLLALGDRCYGDFCGFGHRLHGWLAASGAQALFPPVEVDDEDAQALARWHRQVGEWLTR